MEHLFFALKQQLKYNTLFVRQVSEIKFDDQLGLKVVDFQYRSQSFRMILNQRIFLESQDKHFEISSYRDLVNNLRLKS